MVSASHNPAEDNGLKVLDPSGLKLDDDLEDELEALILRADELPGAAPGGDRAWRATPRRCSSATSRTGRALAAAIPAAGAPRRPRRRERGGVPGRRPDPARRPGPG